jgi:hypothetical protein
VKRNVEVNLRVQAKLEAVPEPVEGACPEPVEGACPEPVEGACPEPVEGLRDQPAGMRALHEFQIFYAKSRKVLDKTAKVVLIPSD